MKIKIFEQYQEIGLANLLVWIQQYIRPVSELYAHPAAHYHFFIRKIR
jgi:hypothetical protein